MVQNCLELSLYILLSSDLSLVVILASDFSDLDAPVNKPIFEVVSFLEGTDVLALDVLLIVHDHLIVLKKMN